MVQEDLLMRSDGSVMAPSPAISSAWMGGLDYLRRPREHQESANHPAAEGRRRDRPKSPSGTRPARSLDPAPSTT